jgi:hypothetical protein
MQGRAENTELEKYVREESIAHDHQKGRSFSHKSSISSSLQDTILRSGDNKLNFQRTRRLLLVASLDDVVLKLKCCNRREYKGSPLDVSRVSALSKSSLLIFRKEFLFFHYFQ